MKDQKENDQLLHVLREIQDCLKRLERHFEATSSQGKKFTALDNAPNCDNFPKEGKLRADTSTDEVANLAMLENSSDVVLDVPKSEWCLVTEDSVPNSVHVHEDFGPNSSDQPTIDIDAAPRDWRLLPTNDSVVEWKYCEFINHLYSGRTNDQIKTNLYVSDIFLFDRYSMYTERLRQIGTNSKGRLCWSTGVGKPTLNIDNILNSKLTNTPLFYVPYSLSATKDRGIFLSTTEDHGIAAYVYPWTHPTDARLREKYSLLFGSFWAVPADDRLELRLTSPFPSPRDRQKQSEEITIAGLRARYETLASFQGIFDIMDFDHRSLMVTYKFGGSSTAADAESLRLDIGPVGPYYRAGTSISRSLSPLTPQKSLIRSTSWRRLM